MEDSDLTRYKTPVLVISVVILVWAALGTIDVGNQAYRGYVTDGNNTVTGVTEGGPADEAGFQAGDYIRVDGGIRVEDAREIAARGRAQIGEARNFVVERDGQTVNLTLTYSALPLSNRTIFYGGVTVGILFLVFGVWAFLAVPNKVTGLLALVGICFSPAMTAGPYFESVGIRTAVGIVVFFVVAFAFAFLTHFLLMFPKRKKMLERRGTVWAIYLPVAAVGLLAFWQLVLQTSATSAANVWFRLVIGLFVVVYFGASLLALIHSYVKTESLERAASGLNLMLTGAVVGLGPSLVIAIVGLVAPRVVVPGANFLPLAVGLLPVTFALAAVRVSRATQVV